MAKVPGSSPAGDGQFFPCSFPKLMDVHSFSFFFLLNLVVPPSQLRMAEPRLAGQQQPVATSGATFAPMVTTASLPDQPVANPMTAVSKAVSCVSKSVQHFLSQVLVHDLYSHVKGFGHFKNILVSNAMKELP